NDATDPSLLTNPSSIDVEWKREWLRWDGLTYTGDAGYTNYSESTDLSYALLYSPDNGVSWKYMQDNSTATPGVRPAAGLLQSGTTFSWDVPAANFPEGNYIIRVEAYRNNIPLHYSYHQYRVFIRRD